jgi:hypothetical protein
LLLILLTISVTVAQPPAANNPQAKPEVAPVKQIAAESQQLQQEIIQNLDKQQ